jgi:hypothetical protein
MSAAQRVLVWQISSFDSLQLGLGSQIHSLFMGNCAYPNKNFIAAGKEPTMPVLTITLDGAPFPQLQLVFFV